MSFGYIDGYRILGHSLLRDPYSECVNSDILKSSLASRGNYFSFIFIVILAVYVAFDQTYKPVTLFACSWGYLQNSKN